MRSTTTIQVRYAETDQMGIAHHSNYPIWFEAARTELSKACGFSYLAMEQAGILNPLVELQIRFIKPLRYDDIVNVDVWIAEVSPVKLVFRYSIMKAGEVMATGMTLQALVGRDLKPLNLKKVHPELYQKFLAAVEKEAS